MGHDIDILDGSCSGLQHKEEGQLWRWKGIWNLGLGLKKHMYAWLQRVAQQKLHSKVWHGAKRAFGQAGLAAPWPLCSWLRRIKGHQCIHAFSSIGQDDAFIILAKCANFPSRGRVSCAKCHMVPLLSYGSN